MKTKRKRNSLFSPFVLLSILYSVIFVANVKPVSGAVSDPNFYYYSSGRRILLPLSKEMIAVRFKPEVTLEEQKEIVESRGNFPSFSERKELSVLKITLLSLREGLTEEIIIQTINSLNTRSEIKFANPVFHFPDAELTLTDEFIVKFNPSVSEADIESFNTLNNVEIARKKGWTDWYVLRVKDPTNLNTLKTANLYYENPITVFSLPNFVRRLEPVSVTPDDTYFQQQWALNNIEQDPPGGTIDADIDAPEGWEISTGSSNIVIAIIDTGVDLAHEDLNNKLVGGYDFVDNDNDPSPLYDAYNAHGTACAGIAAAQTNNAIGVAGVAWGCKIMPVRIAYVIGGVDWWRFITCDEWLAGGIQWAADNGADVLSNSWGGGSESDTINTAIINAKNNGRDGKGCVVVFASGNSAGPVFYPAYHPEVIAVGATDHHDERWYYSNYGPELDVVAPSAWGSDAGVIFWTTDVSGSAGDNDGDLSKGDAAGNYTKWFDGTSAAAPEVAGLAGLILSRNSCFSSDEVQSIIESTADDKGDVGWDEYYGWGRINVHNALDAVGPSPPCAYDGSVTTQVDTAVEIALKALDEGLPDPPGILTYIITSLPSHGTLSDPGAGAISSVPYTLANNGNHVVYTPDAGYKGPDSFTFKANDGGTPPNGGDSDEATINVAVFGPDHWWKLDETSETTAYDSAGTKNGTLTNMDPETDWVDGKRDGGLDFDGDNDYVSFSAPSAIVALKGDTVTISAWIKANNASASYGPIVTQYHSGYFGYDLCLTNGKPSFFLDDTLALAGDAISSNEWCHLAGTYDSQKLRIYVDGVLKDTESYAGESGADTDAYIGYGIYNDTYFGGIIDDVRVYNLAVNVDEILDKMYYGTTKFSILNESGIRVAWFDDLGNLFLKGTEQTTWQEPSGLTDEFIVENTNGPVVYIDNSGDLFLKTGSVIEETTPTATDADEFRVKDSSGTDVDIINSTNGNIYLKGKLYQQNP